MAYDLQALDPLYWEKVAKVLRDFGEKGAYYIANGVLFFKNRVIVPV